MPFWALTAPPSGPVVGTGVTELELEDEGEDEGEDEDEDELLAALPGTGAPVLSRISTWPAATVELAVAVTANCDAIRLA